MFSPILPFAQKIADERAVFATKPRAWLVGGCVRDRLRGEETFDLDIEVFGVPAERVLAIAREVFGDKLDLVGQSFGIIKVFAEPYQIDIALPRRESKAGRGHKGFLIESDPELDPREAARRRDFTINAMMMDPLTDEIFDPFDGQADLQRQVLHVVDSDTFVDDPLRVYRGVQFAARFDLTVDEETLDLMRAMVGRGDLDELSKERVTDEWKKLLVKAPRPSRGFELMNQLGILARYFPIFDQMEATPQEPDWHPEGNVGIHTRLAVDQAAMIFRREGFVGQEALTVMLGTLCHDFGKPATTMPGLKDGVMRIRSLGHDAAGVEPTETFFQAFTFGEDIQRTVIELVRIHLQPGMLFKQWEKGTINQQGYVNGVRKMIKKIYPASWKLLLAVAEADFHGRGEPIASMPYLYGASFAQIVAEYGLDREPPKPLIQGSDLIERGLQPGPRFGEVIQTIEHLRDEGKIQTREEALTELDRMLNSR